MFIYHDSISLVIINFTLTHDLHKKLKIWGQFLKGVIQCNSIPGINVPYLVVYPWIKTHLSLE